MRLVVGRIFQGLTSRRWLGPDELPEWVREALGWATAPETAYSAFWQCNTATGPGARCYFNGPRDELIAFTTGGLVTADVVRPGAAVVDVGITRGPDGLVGDVAPDVREVAGHLAPVPGGVGPMTRAMLLLNVVESAERSSA